MSEMNRPMPTTIAVLSDDGTALKTAVRNPVRTRKNMMTPAHTTRPMRFSQVRSGVVEMVAARKALMPRPADMAKGWLAMTPIRMVMTPEINAVAAATRARPSSEPLASAISPRTKGFRTTM